MDGSFLQTASISPSLGAPVETSTPYSLETAHQLAEERAQVENNLQAALTHQIPARQERQHSVVGNTTGKNYQREGEMTGKGFNWEEQEQNSGLAREDQQGMSERVEAAENRQQMMINMAGQWQNYGDRSEMTPERYNWENEQLQQNQLEPPEQMSVEDYGWNDDASSRPSRLLNPIVEQRGIGQRAVTEQPQRSVQTSGPHRQQKVR